MWATIVFVPVYFLPLYFQLVKANTAIWAGVRILPYVVFRSVIDIISGLLVGKTGYFVAWHIFAGIFCISGAACLFMANIYGYDILLALGSGSTTQLTFAVASLKVTPADVGRSTG
ncbi:hypothetical protein Daus18300_004870 [Diaporthe australafricana]|uniref:Uncharacterized protein n=1 Tax=Diaporthe australafricana TaxID=127596 RepID=A0ABR3X653_9PEZI